MIINVHSYHSLRYGTLSIKDIIELALKYGIETLALTDINNTSCALDFIKYANSFGIKPIIGVEFRNNGKLLYTAFAKSNEGLYQINKYLSSFLLERIEIPEVAPILNETFIVYPFGKIPSKVLPENHFIGVLPHEVNRLVSLTDKELEKHIAIHTITYQSKKRFYNLHKILRAIDLNKVLHRLEESNYAPPNQFFVPLEKLNKKYLLFPNLISKSKYLIKNCFINFEYSKPKNKKCFTHNETTDYRLLIRLAWQGFEYRYGKKNKEAQKRIKKELKVIKQLGFSSYFLITWDILQYAASKGYHHIGRGSGANSIVAYCLKITDVDPIELDLYFERFINPHRTSPPDFDIDFSWDERDDIIDYVFKKHGTEYVSLIATYNTFKGKSAIREISKTLGLPKEEIDRLIKQPNHFLNNNSTVNTILKYASMLEGFPNYLGIHAGGIIISEKPLFYYTAMQMMPKGFPIVHWDMYVAEEIGFYKFDVLSQRGLGHIKEAVQIVKKNKGIDIDIHQIEKFKSDPKVKAQLKSGHTIGCFYIESPAMRGLLNKLRCDNYLSLVAASSIIRPGVAQSGMMKQYIERFHKADFKYLHPVMKELLEETYGIMIYQEDVIKIAHHFAGIPLADADILRRAMSGKFRSKKEMNRITELFYSNCKKKGYSLELTKEVWRQIESFSGYSFSKAHSASYAVESFQSLYLKAHFPLEFMVAVINNRGGFYSTEYYVHEARMAGAKIEAPCVNFSNANTNIMNETIYLGLSFVNELEYKLVKLILNNRNTFGKYKDLYDFLDRIKPSTEQVTILIRINALRFTGWSKKQLIWQSQYFLKSVPKKTQNNSLFKFETKMHSLPKLTHNPFDDIIDQLELLNYPLCSPFELLKDKNIKSIKASDLYLNEHKKVFILGYYVNQKKVKTVKGEIMKFGCFLDTEGKYFDSVMFPDTLKKYPLNGKGCYLMYGKVVLEFGYPSIEVLAMKKLALKARDEYVVESININKMITNIKPTHEKLIPTTNPKAS